MCGRYKLTSPPEALRQIFGAMGSLNFPARYNICPTDQAPVVYRSDAGSRKLELMRWGFVPGDSRHGPSGKPLINARAETITKVASFRSAYRRRRCLVLADGFYEWTVTSDGRQPHLFRKQDQSAFCFAGLWESWQEPQGGPPLLSFTILTTAASDLVLPIHHRMPVILAPDEIARWLGKAEPSDQELCDMTMPGKDKDFVVYPASKRVNSSANDDPGCVGPVEIPDQEKKIGKLL